MKRENLLDTDCLNSKKDERKPIEGMIDCNGQQVYEGDIVEFLNWGYASRSQWNEKKQDHEYSPLYGVVKWNTEYFTYEPLISAIDDYTGNCFAFVCSFRETWRGYPEIYYKVIGNVQDNPELLEKLEITQTVR